MGQYYRACILKDNFRGCPKNPVLATLSPYDFDNGAKLMEHSYCGNSYVNAVSELLDMKNFGGCRFVWCGDYADPYRKDTENAIYQMVSTKLEKDGLANLSKRFLENPYRNYTKRHKYILNFTKMLYVEIPWDRYKKAKDELVVHPLPLLCCDGNGRGGGDYHGTDMEFVGVWAYDEIGLSDTLPKDSLSKAWVKIDPLFKEEWN